MVPCTFDPSNVAVLGGRMPGALARTDSGRQRGAALDIELSLKKE